MIFKNSLSASGPVSLVITPAFSVASPCRLHAVHWSLHWLQPKRSIVVCWTIPCNKQPEPIS